MVKFKEKSKNANEMHIKTQKKTRYLTIVVLCYQINSFLFILLHFWEGTLPENILKIMDKPQFQLSLSLKVS